MITRYPKNVPGDFYVEEGCCVTCAVPMAEAPEFFEMDDEQCYVVRQPASMQEADYLLNAIGTQEVGCIRYAGEDKSIIVRMVDNGDGDSCDSPSVLLLLRTIAKFTYAAATPEAFLRQFVKAAQKHARAARHTINFSKITMQGEAAQIDLILYGRLTGSLLTTSLGPATFKMSLKSETGYMIALAERIHNLLATVPVKDVWWMNQFEWDNGLGERMP